MTTMTVVKVVVSVAACVAVGSAQAQFGNPAGRLPGTSEAQPGVPAPGHPNVPDRLFLQLLGAGNAGEVALARLAAAQAAGPAVKAYAQQMVQDHDDMGRRAGAAGRTLNVPVPADPGPDQRAALASLKGFSGASFDAAFLQVQLVEHQKTVGLLQWELGNGQEASVQALAKSALPGVLGHLRQVQALLGQVTAAGEQGLATPQPGR